MRLELLLCLVACADSPGRTHTVADNTLTFDANDSGDFGVAWLKITATLSTTELGVGAFNEMGEQFGLAAGNTPGTYVVGAGMPTSIQYASSATGTWQCDESGGTGQVTVTTINPDEVIGTFSGMLLPKSGQPSSMIITNGMFDISY